MITIKKMMVKGSGTVKEIKQNGLLSTIKEIEVE